MTEPLTPEEEEDTTIFGPYLIADMFKIGGPLLNVLYLPTKESLYAIEEGNTECYLIRWKDNKTKKFNLDKLDKLIDGVYRIVQKEANKELERLENII